MAVLAAFALPWGAVIRQGGWDHYYAVRLGAWARLARAFEEREAATRLISFLEPVRDPLGSAATTAFSTRPLAQALGELHAMLGDRAAALSAFLEAEKAAGLWGADHLAAGARACGKALRADGPATPSPAVVAGK